MTPKRFTKFKLPVSVLNRISQSSTRGNFEECLNLAGKLDESLGMFKIEGELSVCINPRDQNVEVPAE